MASLASCSICGIPVKFNTMRKLWVDHAGNANTCHSGGRHNRRVFSAAEILGAAAR